MYNAMGNLKEGANVQQTFLTALEHNGFNRPLQGLAQVARAFTHGEVMSTDKGGDFLAGNDLWSLATMARLAGGKPLDEALVRDVKYRSNMYQRYDQDRRNRAAEALRVSMLGTGEYSDSQLDSVFDMYLRSGGDQARFNSWALGQMERATIPEAERLSRTLRYPYSQRMQELMGGY